MPRPSHAAALPRAGQGQGRGRCAHTLEVLVAGVLGHARKGGARQRGVRHHDDLPVHGGVGHPARARSARAQRAPGGTRGGAVRAPEHALLPVLLGPYEPVDVHARVQAPRVGRLLQGVAVHQAAPARGLGAGDVLEGLQARCRPAGRQARLAMRLCTTSRGPQGSPGAPDPRQKFAMVSTAAPIATTAPTTSRLTIARAGYAHWRRAFAKGRAARGETPAERKSASPGRPGDTTGLQGEASGSDRAASGLSETGLSAPAPPCGRPERASPGSARRPAAAMAYTPLHPDPQAPEVWVVTGASRGGPPGSRQQAGPAAGWLTARRRRRHGRGVHPAAPGAGRPCGRRGAQPPGQRRAPGAEQGPPAAAHATHPGRGLRGVCAGAAAPCALARLEHGAPEG